MLKSLFATPRKMPADVEAELYSLGRAQFRHLPCSVRKDIGLDCDQFASIRELRW